MQVSAPNQVEEIENSCPTSCVSVLITVCNCVSLCLFFLRKPKPGQFFFIFKSGLIDVNPGEDFWRLHLPVAQSRVSISF